MQFSHSFQNTSLIRIKQLERLKKPRKNKTLILDINNKTFTLNINSKTLILEINNKILILDIRKLKQQNTYSTKL